MRIWLMVTPRLRNCLLSHAWDVGWMSWAVRSVRINLASAYQEAGRVAEAVILFEQLLSELQRVVGLDHPHTVTARNNLADA